MLSIIAALALAAASLSSADQTALEQLKNGNDLAWDRKDTAFITAQYVPDATIRVAPDAPLVSGQKAIGEFFASSFARREGEFRHVTKLAHFDMLSDGSVLSEGDVRVEKRGPDGSWSLVRRFRTISVTVRTAAGWKLRSVRAIPLN